MGEEKKGEKKRAKEKGRRVLRPFFLTCHLFENPQNLQ
jgi:hypothetical protein